jgi:hypothetical protein
MERTQLAALALTAATLATSGCGRSSSSAKPLTRAELIAKADVICRRVNVKFASTKVTSQRDLASVSSEISSYEQQAFAELSKLTPPTSLASDWSQILTATHTFADNTAKISDYAKSSNVAAERGLFASSQALRQQITTTAKRDGFSDCGQTA